MKYFTIAELCASSTAKARGLDNTPGQQEVANLTNLVDYLLDPLRELYGKPITVTSGYRSPKVNSAVGGSATSEHKKGMAADISGANKEENRKLFQLIRDNFVFGQLIDEKDFSWVHVSFNPGNMRNQVLRYNGSSYTVISDGADTPNPLTPGNTVNGVRVGSDLRPDGNTGTAGSKKKVLLISAACVSLAAIAGIIIYIMYKRKSTTI